MRKLSYESEKIKEICFINETSKTESIIRQLSTDLGIPAVENVLTLYFSNDVRLKCNSDTVIIGRKKSAKDNIGWQEFSLSSRFLGVVLNVFTGIGLTKASISNVLQVSFPEKEGTKITYLRDTLISKHQFEILRTGSKIPLSSALHYLLNTVASETDVAERISYVLEEPILDNLEVLNDKIITFCKQNNISLSCTPKTNYYHRMSSVSNDYTNVANFFELVMNQKLLDIKPLSHLYLNNIPTASIIIPSYNSSDSLTKTLLSLEMQKPSELDFEVIIVDDGSTTPVKKIVSGVSKYLSYSPVIVRKEKNSGISQTRNIGASLAKNEILVFIDSDIVLTQNYLYEHLVRHSLIKKAVLVSFKENVNSRDKRISRSSIKQGIALPDYKNDLRITKYLDKDSLGYYADTYVMQGDVFSILTQTNYFKDLGYGRRIGVFDLPSMVVGHNFTMPRKLFHSIGGFDNAIEGYGLEDSYIGIKAIAAGAFVIPVLSCGVYHIDHATRRGDANKLREEFESNSKKIASFLASSENEIYFS